MGHLPQSQLREGLEKAKQQITIGGRYAHYKDTSKTYVVAILPFSKRPKNRALFMRLSMMKRLHLSGPFASG